MKTINSLFSAIASRPTRSHWEKAVKSDALNLLDNIRDIVDKSNGLAISAEDLESALLNGARTWTEYSTGGSALVYNTDIAQHYCTPSELKRSTRRDGALRWMANPRENWLDVQARALSQAATLVIDTYLNL